jgi:hypothetical protein
LRQKGAEIGRGWKAKYTNPLSSSGVLGHVFSFSLKHQVETDFSWAAWEVKVKWRQFTLFSSVYI